MEKMEKEAAQQEASPATGATESDVEAKFLGPTLGITQTWNSGAHVT